MTGQVLAVIDRIKMRGSGRFVDADRRMCRRSRRVLRTVMIHTESW